MNRNIRSVPDPKITKFVQQACNKNRRSVPESNADSRWMSPIAVRGCNELRMVVKWMQYVFWATQQIHICT